MFEWYKCTNVAFNSAAVAYKLLGFGLPGVSINFLAIVRHNSAQNIKVTCKSW